MRDSLAQRLKSLTPVIDKAELRAADRTYSLQ